MRIENLSILFFWTTACRFAAAQSNVSELGHSISRTRITNFLAGLSDVAKASGGNRAFGLPGYRASADFVLKTLAPVRSEVDVRMQEFEALYAAVEEIQLREVGASQDTYVFGPVYSPSTPPEGLTNQLSLGPEGDAACSAEGYEGRNVTGRIVLVRRGRCPDGTTIAGRIRPATAAGAIAVIIYNHIPTKPTGGTLNNPDLVGFRPAGLITMEDGEQWKQRIENGETINVFFKHIQIIEPRKTWNILAGTKTGEPTKVIMFGAHLDSVPIGPGINDNGSGSALLVELVRAIAKYKPPRKARFAWFGAEENGLFGSEHYVSSLTSSELAKIQAYVNFDMVSRGHYGVLDGDGSSSGAGGPPGSDRIENFFLQYYKEQNITTVADPLDGGSDYDSFQRRNIAVGGVTTGSAPEDDPCYHKPCDTLENANITLLVENTLAAAYVLGKLVNEGI